MDYSLDLYTYRVSCMVSGADGVDSECRQEEVDVMKWPRSFSRASAVSFSDVLQPSSSSGSSSPPGSASGLVRSDKQLSDDSSAAPCCCRCRCNKTEELLLLNQTNKDFSAASALCFTETWLSELTPDSALHLPGFQLHRADRDAERSGKSRGGGICFYITERWCRDTTVLLKSCSPHLESLLITCRPFYSPREFSSFILAGIYIAPSACTSDALKQLAEQITEVEREFPDSLLITLGDFNSADLTKEIPKYRQHIACPTREGNTLDKCYTCIKNAVTRAAVGLSDHSLVHLIPTDRQKLKTNKPVITTVKRWTSGDTEKLQGCLESTNWAVSEEATDGLDEYTDTVTSYISFCEDSCISTKSQVRYSNNKPWFTAELKQPRREEEEAFRSGDRTVFKEAKYRLEKGIRAAKSEYSDQLNRHSTAHDPSSASHCSQGEKDPPPPERPTPHQRPE
ncbi:hypothetical protein NFI96_004923 [Prochilodus magdalenae]|nr:hypothetical protein NFI96_004923 [Prochilodus magdalenae]